LLSRQFPPLLPEKQMRLPCLFEADKAGDGEGIFTPPGPRFGLVLLWLARFMPGMPLLFLPFCCFSQLR
jgi:hypothetical protein